MDSKDVNPEKAWQEGRSQMEPSTGIHRFDVLHADNDSGGDCFSLQGIVIVAVAV